MDYVNWLKRPLAEIKGHGIHSGQWEKESEPFCSLSLKAREIVTEWSILFEVWTGPLSLSINVTIKRISDLSSLI